MKLRFGRGEVEIVRGEITREESHAIVVPFLGSHDFFGIMGSVARAGGDEIFEERARVGSLAIELGVHKKLKCGTTLVTGSGKLPSKMVIHATTFNPGRKKVELYINRNSIKKGLGAALRAASNMRAESISIPSVHAVQKQWRTSVKEGIEAALDAVRLHFRRQSNLKIVRLVFRDEPDYLEAIEAAGNYRK